MSASHMFDINIATKHGLVEAILIQNLSFWITKNRANEKNLHDGRYWTYNTTKAFCELFPYLTKNKINTAVSKLIKNNVIKQGNYNKSNYDRTRWFSFVNESLYLPEIDAKTSVDKISTKTEMGLLKIRNGLSQKQNTIPDSKPDSKPDSNKESTKEKQPQSLKLLYLLNLKRLLLTYQKRLL